MGISIELVCVCPNHVLGQQVMANPSMSLFAIQELTAFIFHTDRNNYVAAMQKHASLFKCVK